MPFHHISKYNVTPDLVAKLMTQFISILDCGYCQHTQATQTVRFSLSPWPAISMILVMI